ncbi:MAG TPA: SWIB/MDM2 domain-containing protein, partial [Thermoanaerobaculia bacterium]|nr:SWIB/MDM2 domain-containing protein [Thermoanaerobaculia bacterium]
MKPVQPDEALAAVVGSTPQPRTEITKKIWDYIKAHKLQDPANKRMIKADDKLKVI